MKSQIQEILSNPNTQGFIGGNRVAFDRMELDNLGLIFMMSEEHNKPYLTSNSSFQVAVIPKDYGLLAKGIYFCYD